MAVLEIVRIGLFIGQMLALPNTHRMSKVKASKGYLRNQILNSTSTENTYSSPSGQIPVVSSYFVQYTSAL